MNSEELKAIESRRQTLLEQLSVAETALRRNLHTHDFGNTAREHMERALAHIREAYVAFNEMGHARTVQQLVNDLVRIQQVMDGSRPGQSQRI
ncbi:MAG TPA: hypothetical protein VMR33_09930 [Candidatus Baltobacteraceae bacterium]|jgi:hypothetical protein|nr:hypothetical protein [Candidatus Baltobacteraceae bacterium]